MKVAIIKYNAGNIQSVSFALNRLGIEPLVTDKAEELSNADKIIFPGVGEASSAMNYLKEKKLDLLIKNTQQPLLGICLGMQLLCSYSDEGNTNCLAVFNTQIKKFKIAEKVPHVGWNTVIQTNNRLFKNINNESYFYFVHSFYAENNFNSIANCNYGINFCCALNHKNFYGVQFHPEKSGRVGEQVLNNFLSL